MKPGWFLALAYLLMCLAWLHLGLLGLDNDDRFHGFVPLIQATGAALALIAALLLPRVNGLTLHALALALIAVPNAVLTFYAFTSNTWFTAAHAAQTLGLLVVLWYVIQWWASSGGVRYARRLAAGYVLAAMGALAMIGLDFIGQGHPFQTVQRPYAAADDGMLAVAYLLAAWMGGVAALKLKTPEPIIQP